MYSAKELSKVVFKYLLGTYRVIPALIDIVKYKDDNVETISKDLEQFITNWCSYGIEDNLSAEELEFNISFVRDVVKYLVTYAKDNIEWLEYVLLDNSVYYRHLYQGVEDVEKLRISRYPKRMIEQFHFIGHTFDAVRFTIKTGILIDVGCGEAVYENILKKHNPSLRYLGIDKTLPKNCEGFLDLTGDLRSIQFDASLVTCIFMSEILHCFACNHYKFLVKFLEEFVNWKEVKIIENNCSSVINTMFNYHMERHKGRCVNLELLEYKFSFQQEIKAVLSKDATEMHDMLVLTRN